MTMGICNSNVDNTNDVVVHESKVLSKFRSFAKKYNIPEEFIHHYRKLRNTKIVIVADDSNSMRADAYSGDFLTADEKKFQTVIPTRFDELKMMTRMILEFAGILSNQGVDVRFLNRGQKWGVRQMEELESILKIQSNENCLTPIVQTLEKLIDDERRQNTLTEGNLLLYIITDGLNTNQNGEKDVKQMDNCIQQIMQYENVYITFVATCDNEDLLQNMDKYSQMYSRVGVVDQWRVEQKEQAEKHGKEPEFSFTLGDLLTKLALVSLIPQVKEKFRDDEDDDKGKPPAEVPFETGQYYVSASAPIYSDTSNG